MFQHAASVCLLFTHEYLNNVAYMLQIFLVLCFYKFFLLGANALFITGMCRSYVAYIDCYYLVGVVTHFQYLCHRFFFSSA